MMPNRMQMAIIKKDIFAIASNKRMLSVLVIVPVAMTVVIPLVFMLSVLLPPPGSPSMEQFVAMLDAAGLADGIGDMQPDDLRHAILALILNNVLPLFFLMIPVTASSAMAASAFVGEKEKSTLETLLYCPLPLREIFAAKIMASFSVGFAVSFLALAAKTIVFQGGVAIATGGFVMPGVNWLVVLFLVSPAISLIAINLIVRGSAKAHSSEESQQRSVFLILPIVLLAVGQLNGVLLLGTHVFLGIGLGLAALALFMFRGTFGGFRYETLLR
ncbi:MAG: ABC transporter permease subunit [Treponema sp.]|nr:ABC transporter permease subunit [Treponema sp.]